MACFRTVYVWWQRFVSTKFMTFLTNMTFLTTFVFCYQQTTYHICILQVYHCSRVFYLSDVWRKYRLRRKSDEKTDSKFTTVMRSQPCGGGFSRKRAYSSGWNIYWNVFSLRQRIRGGQRESQDRVNLDVWDWELKTVWIMNEWTGSWDARHGVTEALIYTCVRIRVWFSENIFTLHNNYIFK